MNNIRDTGPIVTKPVFILIRVQPRTDIILIRCSLFDFETLRWIFGINDDKTMQTIKERR